MSDRPHEQLCQALEDYLGYDGHTCETVTTLLHFATADWRLSAHDELLLREDRDHVIQLAHKHGLDTNTITQAIGGLPDGRQLLAHTTVQHLTTRKSQP